MRKIILKCFQSFTQLYLIKEFDNLWSVSIWELKRQFCRYRRSGNFRILNSLYTCVIESCCFFKQNFSQVSVLKFLNYFGLVIFDWIHSWDPYNKWEQKETDMSSLKILKDVQKDFYLCFWMTLICVMCNFFSSISVPAFFPRIILKLHNFVVTPRWLNRL